MVYWDTRPYDQHAKKKKDTRKKNYRESQVFLLSDTDFKITLKNMFMKYTYIISRAL